MEQELKTRTRQIGVDVLKLISELPQNQTSWIIVKQIVRSSTSIGANYRAACRGKSAADFINKLTIVEEESDETLYWLEVIELAGLAKPDRTSMLKDELNQIIAMTVASIKTSRAKLDIKKR
jgi:four helix bundle protein